MHTYNTIDKCPISHSNEKIIYLDLGLMPLVNNLTNTKEESLNCQKYPLAVQLFKNSNLSSLTAEIEPDILYQHYLYKSSVSQPYVDHCKMMFDFVNTYLNLTKDDLILDVGGNDGTLLKTFLTKNSTLNVLNIDASENLTKESLSNNIPSINGYWGVELSKKINKKFKLITTTNCFQHTAPINDFVEAISLSLDKFGIWCLEFPYWKTSIETNQFDQVYHEHVYYYLLNPLIKLFDKYNLQIIKATQFTIHGGTMRLLVTHKNTWTPCSTVNDVINSEQFTINDYISWGNHIKSNIGNSKEFILSLKNKGAKIAGFGAAAKGCIYLNAAGIDCNQIDYIIDDTNIKQGKFIPGTGIEVVPRSNLHVNPVDYIVILAHNFSEYIIKSLRQDGYQGKFIIFLPEMQII